MYLAELAGVRGLYLFFNNKATEFNCFLVFCIFCSWDAANFANPR